MSLPVRVCVCVCVFAPTFVEEGEVLVPGVDIPFVFEEEVEHEGDTDGV